ncbi:MAG: PLP-dependent aminotransferase family protein [Pseudomonadota bacterium]
MNTNWAQGLTFRDGPKYLVLRDAIAGAVEQGHLTADDKLPPVRDLAYNLGITPGTVARAYSILTDQGVLRGEVGRGTFVANKEPLGIIEQEIPLVHDPVPHGMEHADMPVSLLSPGMPNVGQAAYLRQLMASVSADPPSGIMHYPTREAFKPAREAVKHWLRDVDLGMLDEIDIVLAHGGQNAILLVMQAVLRGRRPAVMVEELSYPGFRRAAELLRADVIPVAMDDHGIIPESLEAAAGAEVQLLCTTPGLHNPTTVFTPAERRREIAAVARRCGFHILEDDWYRLANVDAPTYRQLVPERGWYVSSISKLITPSLRVGYAISPPGGGAFLRRAAEHGFFGLATLLADATARLLTDPTAEAFAQKTTEAYEERLRIVLNHLGGYDIKWREGSPILWLTLPEGWRTAAFCAAAEAVQVRVRSAEDFASREARVPHAVRIALNAAVSLETFEEAIQKLRGLLETTPERVVV